MNIYRSLLELLQSWSFNAFWSDAVTRILIGISVLLLACFVWLLAVRIVYRILEKILKRLKIDWAHELLKRRFFHRLAWLAPAVVIRFFSPTFLTGKQSLQNAIIILCNLIMIISVTMAVIVFLNFVNFLYIRRKDADRRPIKGIIQAVQVLIIIVAVLLIISNMTSRPLSGLITGIGAISAVLMLIFRDPLMGLVAGFQISSNDMVRIGDWVEMPAHGVDGEVIDISLLNVTIRNWDKNYLTLPIQFFTTGAFKNWRGMTDCGGRRIKRSLSIDLSSIRFLTENEIDKLSSITLLKDYLKQKSEEIHSFNSERGEDRDANPVNGRAHTNIGVFRAYILAYLRNHSKIRNDLSLMVRQLQSGSEGLPLEIYLFTNVTEWVNYENIQSDIFDHLLASLGEFGLKAFQQPSGTDLKKLVARK